MMSNQWFFYQVVRSLVVVMIKQYEYGMTIINYKFNKGKPLNNKYLFLNKIFII